MSKLVDEIMDCDHCPGAYCAKHIDMIGKLEDLLDDALSFVDQAGGMWGGTAVEVAEKIRTVLGKPPSED